MSGSSDYADLLIDLGLTIDEAKVFLALSGVQQASAKTIAKSSGVAREVVYQVMRRLEKRGLVEEFLVRPKTFKALSVTKALEILLKHRREATRNLAQEIKEVIKPLQNKDNAKSDEPFIMILPPRAEDSTWRKLWLNVQETVDMTMPVNKFLQCPKTTPR